MKLSIGSVHEKLLLHFLHTASQPRFVIVGAAALGCHIELSRTTSDVDLAIVAEPEEVAAMMHDFCHWKRDSHQKGR